MKVLFVSSEAAPYAKTGGLGDVAGSLPKELRRQGIDARLVIPNYESVPDDYKQRMKEEVRYGVKVGWRQQHCGVKSLESESLPVYFIDNEYYFKRPQPYGYGDEAERFAFFSLAVLEALKHLDFQPDIIHCNDWQTALTPLYLQDRYREDQFYESMRTAMTIHSLKYQGIFPAEILEDVLGLSPAYMHMESLEFNGGVNFMKGGLLYSDMLTTVSPTYSREIQYAYFGEGLEGVLGRRGDRLKGILNGIDYGEWNPATDQKIPVQFDQTATGKERNKLELQKRLGLAIKGEVPVIGMVTRLTPQKGLDLVVHVIEDILAMDVQLVILGVGEEQYESFFRDVASRHPNQASMNTAFDEGLAHLIYAGSDMFLMPSLFEPCGLSQLIAMRYGSVPIVRETGGLKDTVQPYNRFTGEGNGFSFTNYNAHDMLFTVERAVRLYYNRQVWLDIVKEAMSRDYSWERSAREYIGLYSDLLGNGGGEAQRG